MRSTVVVAVLFSAALAVATITPNPDTWELPPAAPNYAYNSQGLIGSGSLSTLIIARDPVAVNGLNSSLFAFAVSGGLVPMNYLEIDACASTMVSNLLVCDVPSPTGGVATFYQLGLQANGRIEVVHTAPAPFSGIWGGRAQPVTLPGPNASTQSILWIANSTLAMGGFQIVEVQVPTLESGIAGITFNVIGSLAASVTSLTSFAVNDAVDSLWISTGTGLQWFAFPSLNVGGGTDAWPNTYLLPVTSGDVGTAIQNSKSGLTYTTFSLGGGANSGPVTTDPATAYYSDGLLSIGSQSTTASQLFGPCVYVAGYRTKNDGSYTTLSQVKLSSSATGAAVIEAQVTTNPGQLFETVVANDDYLFAVFGEIMYRWKVQC